MGIKRLVMDIILISAAVSGWAAYCVTSINEGVLLDYISTIEQRQTIIIERCDGHEMEFDQWEVYYHED